MAQPAPYNRIFSFTNYSAANPTIPLPGMSVDSEFNLVQATLAQTLANLKLIQADDGTIAPNTIGPAQLSTSITVGFTAPAVWVTAHAYGVSPVATVFKNSAFYSCLVAHTSGVFATDLAAGKWVLIFDLSGIPLTSANQVAVTPAGGITAVQVQQALQDLDTGKAPTSHTHASSAITDSTAAGRAMLVAANVAAQQALLGLGALAFLNTIAVTTLATTVGFTGIIAPAALSGNVNDWNPTGWSTASTIRLTANTPINITGLVGGVDGRFAIFEGQPGSSNITLTNQDTGSAQANRFVLPKGHSIRQGQPFVLKYNQSLQSGAGGWAPVSVLTTFPVAADFKNLKLAPGASPDSQIAITADYLTLEDANGEMVRLANVSVTASNLTLGAANGLDAGVNTISTWYSAWVIYNPVTNVVASLLSTSATAPTMPAGYTFKARVGWNRTDATASPNCKFNRILQYGRRAQYVVTPATATPNLPAMDSSTQGTFSNTTPTWKAIAVAAYVPTTASRIFGLLGNIYNGGGNCNVQVAPNNNYGGAAGTNPPPLQIASGAAGTWPFEFAIETTNIYWASAGTGAALLVSGWEDNI